MSKKKTAPETAVPGDESPFKATVVSDAHGAKIVETLGSLVKKSEKQQVCTRKKHLRHCLTLQMRMRQGKSTKVLFLPTKLHYFQ